MFSKFFKGSGSHGSSLAVPAYLGLAALGMAALAMNAPTTMGSVITWGSPTDVSGDANVSTTGTLVSAYTIGKNPNGGVTNTVNGVPFTPVGDSFTVGGPTSITLGVDTIACSSGVSGYDGFGAPSTFSSAYKSLLTSAFYNGGSGTAPLTLTLNDLTSGQAYQFEAWANDTRTTITGVSTRTETVGPTGDQVTLAYHTGTLNAGQFVLGTFTADSTGSQVIAFTGNVDSQINAFQLRESVASVPEPASLGLLAVGGLGLMLLGKRRQA